MQSRLSRSRLAGDPPDLLLTPRVRQIAPLESSGGQPAIGEGYNVRQRVIAALNDILVWTGADKASAQ
jgi:NTE family protein